MQFCNDSKKEYMNSLKVDRYVASKDDAANAYDAAIRRYLLDMMLAGHNTRTTARHCDDNERGSTC